MALVTGPLFSVEASGQIAKTLVFAKWKGRQYVREYVIPTNPQSAAQQANRAMMAFISENWAAIDPARQASWLSLAQAEGYSTFNGYSSTNLKRWTEFLAPGQFNPVDGSGTAATMGTTAGLGGVGQATITQPVTTQNDGWGAVLFRSSSSSFTPAKIQVVQVKPFDGTNDIVFIDSGLAAGTYHYQVGHFTELGGFTLSALDEVSAVVT